mmetsp:Transcript_13885/g.37249  ORF Transcript_13885/g.37249 Transcript_13885/m.37249 type:complete len:401 (-) Transcript_13885:37-1239(-)
MLEHRARIQSWLALAICAAGVVLVACSFANGAPVPAIANSSDSKLEGTVAPAREFVLVPETHTASGYGNQLQGLWNAVQISACLGARFVVPPVSYIKAEKRYRSLQLSGDPSTYYDLDSMQKFTKVGLFATECNCFDFVVHPASAQKEKLTDFKSKYEKKLFAKAQHVYVGKGARTWEEFQATDLSSPQWSSSCANPRPCVHLQASKRDGELHVSCKSATTEKIKAAVMPSQLLVRTAVSLLPSKTLLSQTLVVHVRDVAGEYNHFPSICATGENVCIGRRNFSSIPARRFIDTIQTVAKKEGCVYILPIFPKFSSDALRARLAEGFHASLDSLIMSRTDDAEFTLMVERTLAIYAKVFVSETQRTSFSSTLNIQRKALGRKPLVPMEPLFPDSTPLGPD